MISESQLSKCSICFNIFNDKERNPIMLINCGHTYCEICLQKMYNKIQKEIFCPECKLPTKVPKKNVKNLPKNRLALDLISHKNKEFTKSKKGEKKEKESVIKTETEKNNFSASYKKFEELVLNIQNKYEDIYKKNPFLKKEENQSKVIDEVDTILDNYIDRINLYRQNLHEKINKEYSKINSMMVYENTITFLKGKLEEYSGLLDTQKNNSNDIDTEKNFKELDDYEIIEENNNRSFEIINYEGKKECKIPSKNSDVNIPLEIPEKISKEISFEITSSELLLNKIENISNEIFNPYKYLFVDKIKNKNLIYLQELLQRSCNFDKENVDYEIINDQDQDQVQEIEDDNSAIDFNDWEKIQIK